MDWKFAGEMVDVAALQGGDIGAPVASFRYTRSGSLAGRERPAAPLAFRALVDLKSPYLEADGRRFTLAPGMQVIAEIHLGERTVLEYLLSPVRKAFHEAGRER